jgi:predicted dehydrogenase
MSAQPSWTQLAASRPLRLAFVGLGWIGRKRLDAIAQHGGVEVAALFDSDAERLSSAAQEYPAAAACERLDTLLDASVDGVVIATPNAHHAEQAIASLERGIAVFCQKPLATTARDTERVVEAARVADRLLAVDYSYRYVQGMALLRERMLAGELGTITAIDLIFHNAYGPSKQWCFDRSHSGGGCLLDLGVHLVDLALWLQDSPALRVGSSRLYARGRRLAADEVPNEVEDLAFVELGRQDGALVRIACSWDAQIGCGAQISADIHGTRGGAAWRNESGSFVDFELDLLRGDRREHLGSSRDDWGPGALQAWIARLRQDPAFDPSALQVLAGARLIDEAYGAQANDTRTYDTRAAGA